MLSSQLIADLHCMQALFKQDSTGLAQSPSLHLALVCPGNSIAVPTTYLRQK